MPLTRYAPTPSGYLHAGNIANLRIVRRLADEIGAAVALRIDDADAGRYRRDYAADIFRVLRQEGLGWDIGPRDVDDFEREWSQRSRTEAYRDALLTSTLDWYSCSCTRLTLRGIPSGGCSGRCRDAGLDPRPGIGTLRVVVPTGTEVDVGGTPVRLDLAMGDFVVWRRDDLPSYQLVSVIEDRDLGTSHIVRGEDLLASSAAQVFLAGFLGADNVVHATYLHHPLILGPDGRKLSKSTLTRSEET